MAAEPLSLPLIAIAPEVRRRERNRRLIGLAARRAGGAARRGVPVLPARVHRPDELHPRARRTCHRMVRTTRRRTTPRWRRAICRTSSSRSSSRPCRRVVNLIFGFPFAYVLVRTDPVPRRRPGVHGLSHVRGAVHRLRDALHPAARRARDAAPRGARDPEHDGPVTACRRSCSRCPCSRSRSWS